MRYTDPDGHEACSEDNVVYVHGTYTCLPQLNENTLSYYEKLYGIEFTETNGEWTVANQIAVVQAVIDVGGAFANTINNKKLGYTMTPWEAFKSEYGTSQADPLMFEWNTQCSNCRTQATIDKCGNNFSGDCAAGGAFTSSSHHIIFASISPNFMRARNNAVHELGHAFNDARGSGPSDAVTADWNKDDLNRSDCNQKENCGFASPQNNFDWVEDNANTPSEVFADQFLGYVYGEWENSTRGTTRSNWMSTKMDDWLP